MDASKRRPRKPDVRQLLGRLAGEEERFLQGEFLAPAVPGGVVQVRIGGVVCRVRIEPADFEGWGVFRPASMTLARLVRQAGLAERRRYLDLFPLVRLIVCRRIGRRWHGTAASLGDGRFRIDGLAPIELAEEVQPFDVVAARFDGAAFWFDDLDPRRDPGTAAYLREALAARTEPGELARPGLTPEERSVYELAYWELAGPPPAREGRARPQRADREGEAPAEDPVLRRLRESLSHAGARLIGYLERADSFRVTYRIGDQEFTSAVDKNDLTVQVAGICLSGEDQKFDLASLVGVLRQGGAEGVVRVGDENQGMREAGYWRVHPPRNQ